MWWEEINDQIEDQRQLVRRKPYWVKGIDKNGVPMLTSNWVCSRDARRREPVGVSMAPWVRTRQMW
jgi:hypothetical protein